MKYDQIAGRTSITVMHLSLMGPPLRVISFLPKAAPSEKIRISFSINSLSVITEPSIPSSFHITAAADTESSLTQCSTKANNSYISSLGKSEE
jgi:hypothetical protein